MMAKLSLYVRKRVFLENHTARPMKKNRESLLQEGIKTSSCEISLFLCRYRKTGRLIDAPKLKQAGTFRFHQSTANLRVQGLLSPLSPSGAQ